MDAIAGEVTQPLDEMLLATRHPARSGIGCQAVEKIIQIRRAYSFVSARSAHVELGTTTKE